MKIPCCKFAPTPHGELRKVPKSSRLSSKIHKILSRFFHKIWRYSHEPPKSGANWTENVCRKLDQTWPGHKFAFSLIWRPPLHFHRRWYRSFSFIYTTKLALAIQNVTKISKEHIAARKERPFLGSEPIHNQIVSKDVPFLAYAAPELIRAVPYSPQAVDIWALGCVFFVFVNGIMAFDETVEQSVLLYNQRNQVYVWRNPRNHPSAAKRSEYLYRT